jgi:hypothetical protein
MYEAYLIKPIKIKRHYHNDYVVFMPGIKVKIHPITLTCWVDMYQVKLERGDYVVVC